MAKKYVCIPRSFIVINVCNQGRTSCSPCITNNNNNNNNKAVINNNLWKTARPYFAIQNPHGHKIGLL